MALNKNNTLREENPGMTRASSPLEKKHLTVKAAPSRNLLCLLKSFSLAAERFGFESM